MGIFSLVRGRGWELHKVSWGERGSRVQSRRYLVGGGRQRGPWFPGGGGC